MVYSNINSSEIKVSRIGFGCMSLTADEKIAIPVLQTAIDLGINYLDTADVYNDGINEMIIGKAIKGKRDQVILASKAGNVRKPDGGFDWNPSRKHILKSIEGSLKRLQTDHLDLFQLHGGTIQDNIDETIETFELLKQQGKIRYYGISSIRPNVIKEYIKRSSIVSVMTQYSLLDRRAEEQTLELLYNNNVGILARGVVAQGLLIDKQPRVYLNQSVEEVEKMAKAVQELSRNERSATQTAIKFVLQHKGITSAVVGMRTIAQVHEAVNTINVPNLTSEEIEHLRNIITPLKYNDHR